MPTPKRRPPRKSGPVETLYAVIVNWIEDGVGCSDSHYDFIAMQWDSGRKAFHVRVDSTYRHKRNQLIRKENWEGRHSEKAAMAYARAIVKGYPAPAEVIFVNEGEGLSSIETVLQIIKSHASLYEDDFPDWWKPDLEVPDASPVVTEELDLVELTKLAREKHRRLPRSKEDGTQLERIGRFHVFLKGEDD